MVSLLVSREIAPNMPIIERQNEPRCRKSNSEKTPIWQEFNLNLAKVNLCF